MPDEKPEVGQSSDPLYSDFERFGNMLDEAVRLGKQNNKYDPAIIRDYFVILAEVFRFLFPILGANKKTDGTKIRIENLNIATRYCSRQLIYDKTYKVPVGLFYLLDELHSELLILKQMANLGVRLRQQISSKQRIEKALE